jgi:SAM-dependent methyltransferase
VQTDFNLTGATQKPYQVVECRACRFRYLHPRPDAQELARFYAPDYAAYSLKLKPGDALSPEQVSLNRRFRRIALHRLRLLRRFRPPPWTGMRVLDVGCGNAAFLLELLRRHPVEAWGMDINPQSLAELAKLDGRLKLREGDLASSTLPQRYFDVVTLWHVLEHDGDPVGALRRAAGWLRPGGLLLAEVPNAGGLIARICGSSWLGWDLPRHLGHFAAPTLRRAAEQAARWAEVQVLHRYTLAPLTLSPLLASWIIRRRRRQGRSRMKRVAYHRLDGLPAVALRVVNGLEWLLGGNGLLLVARKMTG